METITSLEVVRIPSVPCKASPICLTNIPLIKIGPEDIDKDEYKDFEKELKQIPNMQSHTNFSWAHRSLVGLSNTDLGDDAPADYMMYFCPKEEADLPRNQYLQEILREAFVTGRHTQTVPTPVFGDAFVFKMEPKSKGDESDQAGYIHMDLDFVSDAKNGSHFVRSLLRKLLTHPTKGDLE